MFALDVREPLQLKDGDEAELIICFSSDHACYLLIRILIMNLWTISFVINFKEFIFR